MPDALVTVLILGGGFSVVIGLVEGVRWIARRRHPDWLGEGNVRR